MNSAAVRSRRSTIALLVLALALLTAAWARTTYATYPGFWLVDEEMAVHCLGHGTNIDHSLTRGGHPDSYYQYLHPGVPLQLACWAAFRLAAPNPLASTAEVLRHHLLSPEPFHGLTQVLGLALMLGSVTLVWRRARPLGPLVTAVAVMLPFTHAGMWMISIERLDSDTFAILLACGFAAAMRAAFAKGGGRAWLALGGIVAASYLTKLNHMAWIAGTGAGWLAWVWVQQANRRVAGAALGRLLAGFAAVMGAGAAVMGRDQLGRMLAFQWKVATHSGRYGTDASSLAPPVRWQDAGGLDPAMITVMVLVPVMVAIAVRYRADKDWLRRWLPEGAALAVSMAAGAVMVFKHPGPHYLMPAAALLPFAALWLVEAWNRRMALALLVPALFSLQLGIQSWQGAASRLEVAAERQAEVDAALARPLRDGELRLWGFKVTAAQYLRRMGVQFSGIKSMQAVVDSIQPQDQEFNVWREQVRIANVWHPVGELPWRYAIFDRRYHPDRTTLPEPFRDPSFTVTQGHHILVVERSRGTR